MRVAVQTGWGHWPGGADGWNELLHASAVDVPFLSWQWQTTWWEHFGRPEALRLVTVEDGPGEFIGVLPLTETGPGVLAVTGGTDVSDYLDIIVRRGREEEVWKALLSALAEERWARLDLPCIPVASPTANILPSLAYTQGFQVTVERQEPCPLLELPADWEAYLASLGGKPRHELRRKLRRFERTCPGARPRQVTWADPATLDAFFMLHRKSSGGKARFMDDRMEGFFRGLATAFARAGWLRLWILEAERPLAALLCFDYAGSVHLYNSGFEPEARTVAPGIVLIAWAIRDAIGRGRHRFDFLRGEEPYKHEFGALPRDLMRIVIRR